MNNADTLVRIQSFLDLQSALALAYTCRFSASILTLCPHGFWTKDKIDKVFLQACKAGVRHVILHGWPLVSLPKQIGGFCAALHHDDPSLVAGFPRNVWPHEPSAVLEAGKPRLLAYALCHRPSPYYLTQKATLIIVLSQTREGCALLQDFVKPSDLAGLVDDFKAWVNTHLVSPTDLLRGLGIRLAIRHKSISHDLHLAIAKTLLALPDPSGDLGDYFHMDQWAWKAAAKGLTTITDLLSAFRSSQRCQSQRAGKGLPRWP